MKTCAYCQSSIPDNSARCPSCGSAILQSGGKKAADTPLVPAPSPAMKSGGKLMFLGCIALFGVGAVVVALAGAFMALPMGSSSKTDPQVIMVVNEPAAMTPPSSLADIKARGQLRVAADPAAPPFLNQKPDGSYEGFEYALMQALASRAGVPVEVVPVDYDGLLPAVVGGQADIAIGQLARVSGAPVAWSVSYLQYSLCLVVPQWKSLKFTSELSGKRVGHYDDPAVKAAAAALIGSYTPVLFSDYGYFDQLSAGQLDAVLYDCPLARYELKKYEGKLKIASDSLNVFSYSIGVPLGQAQLLSEVNALVVELGQQGLLGQLQARWLGESSGTGEKFVQVRTGETLEDLAARALGSPARAEDLYKANVDILGDDRKALYGGMRLRLP